MPDDDDVPRAFPQDDDPRGVFAQHDENVRGVNPRNLFTPDCGDPPAPDDDVRSLLARAPTGPPLELTAPDVIARGSRIRRRRKRWAVAGSSVATVAVLALAGFAVGHRAPAAPVEPAGPGLSTVAPSGSPSPTAPPAAVPTRAGESRAPRQAPGGPPRTRAGTETPPRTPRTPTHAPPSATNVPTAPGSAPESAPALPTATQR